MPEGLTEWGLRKAVEREGYPLTHEQLLRFREWGLLPEPHDGRYPEDAVRLVAEIVNQDDYARSLPRRVILLRGNAVDFPVPPDKLKRAMLKVLPTIKAPVRKMTRVHRAIEWYGQRSAASRADYPSKHLPAPRQGTWRPPYPEQWHDLLESVQTEQFGERVGWIFHLVNAVLPMVTRDSRHDLSDIPREEVVILAALRNLALDQAEREKYAAARAPAVPVAREPN